MIISDKNKGDNSILEWCGKRGYEHRLKILSQQPTFCKKSTVFDRISNLLFLQQIIF